MTTERKRRLEKTVTDLQQRFGLRVISRALPAPPAGISSGFPALDEALGIGGFPRGRISEIIGVPTSGMATLAMKAVAQSQAGDGETPGRMAAYLDVEKTFDPEYAARCGIDLGRLVLVRPYSPRQALAMLPDFAINGGFGLVVVDCPLRLWTTPETATHLSTALGRVIAPLHRAGSALLFITGLSPGSAPSLAAYPSQTGLPHYASTRLLIQREQWIYHRRDVVGYEAQVLVVKNRQAAEGEIAHVAFEFAA